MANISKPTEGTRIGFSFNERNGASPVNNRLTINADKTLYFNGERLGMNELETDYLKRKLNEENAAKASVVIEVFTGTSGVNTLDKDALPAQLTVRVTTKYNGKLEDSTSLPTIKIGTQAVRYTKKSTGVYECVIAQGTSPSTEDQAYYNGGFTVTATCSPGGVTKTVSKKVYAYHKIRFGVSELAELTAVSSAQDAMAGFTTRGPQSSAAGEYSFTFPNNTYAYVMIPKDTADQVAIPKSLAGSEPQGVEGVIPVPFKKMNDFLWNGVTYHQYRIAGAQQPSTHTVVFN